MNKLNISLTVQATALQDLLAKFRLASYIRSNRFQFQHQWLHDDSNLHDLQIASIRMDLRMLYQASRNTSQIFRAWFKINLKQ